MPRHAIATELVLQLNDTEPTLARNVAAAIVDALVEGRLQDGDILPSTRTLANQLGVSRSATVAAYEELVASGLLATRAGASTWVEDGGRRASLAGVFATPPKPAVARERPRRPRPSFDLLPGFADTALINARDWNRAVRASSARVRTMGDELADFDRGRNHHFHPELQQNLADHLRRNRGIVCDPDNIFVFSGVSAALRNLAQVLFPIGGSIGFEEPGYGAARRALTTSGLSLEPVPVDEDGIVVDKLGSDLAGAYVTPAHQFPLGARLSAGRRVSLLDWADQNDSLVIEDDYDGEFRYDVAPMPALRAMERGSERVVYLGTSSKTVARGLRLAWAVIPERFREVVRNRLFDLGDETSALSVATLSSFIEDGSLRKQVASTHRVYASRRLALATACKRLSPGFSVLGVSAGLHLVLAARDRTFDDSAAVDRLLERGLACAPLEHYYFATDKRDRQRGLVCGYSRLSATQAENAVKVLRQVIG